MDAISISEAARGLGVPPHRLSNLFFQRRLPQELAPMLCGRRVVPVDSLPELQRLLAGLAEKPLLAGKVADPGQKSGQGRTERELASIAGGK